MRRLPRLSFSNLKKNENTPIMNARYTLYFFVFASLTVIVCLIFPNIPIGLVRFWALEVTWRPASPRAPSRRCNTCAPRRPPNRTTLWTCCWSSSRTSTPSCTSTSTPTKRSEPAPLSCSLCSPLFALHADLTNTLILTHCSLVPNSLLFLSVAVACYLECSLPIRLLRCLVASTHAANPQINTQLWLPRGVVSSNASSKLNSAIRSILSSIIFLCVQTCL